MSLLRSDVDEGVGTDANAEKITEVGHPTFSRMGRKKLFL